MRWTRSAWKGIQTGATTGFAIVGLFMAAHFTQFTVSVQAQMSPAWTTASPAPAPAPGIKQMREASPAPAPPPPPSWLVEHMPSHRVMPHRQWEVRPGIELMEGAYHGARYHLVCVDRANAHVKLAPYKTSWTCGQRLTRMDLEARSIVSLNGTFFEPKHPGARIYGEVKNEMQAYHIPLIKRRTYWAVTPEGRFEMDESVPSGYNAKGRLCYRIPDNRWEGYTYVLGGGGRLLRGGRPSSIGAGYNDEAFKPDVLRRTNRSAIGWSKGQRFFYMVATDQPGWTPAATASFLRDAGAWEGMMLDGGGSTELVVKDHIRNKTKDGKERLMSTAVVVSSQQ